jgi:hypothetical protein
VYSFYQQSIICCEEILLYLPASKQKDQLEKTETTSVILCFANTSNRVKASFLILFFNFFNIIIIPVDTVYIEEIPI